MHNPVSTYRIQFHKGFTFKDFEQIIPYLYSLGIKTVYASPIFEATPGSTHGYDVINPLHINPEIGTLNELKAISKKLKKLNISWLQDIVPNHMAFHPNNKWLMDVLEKGQKSIYAPYFDILWTSPVYNGRIMVPFLGAPLTEVIKNGQLEIIYQDKQLLFSYGGQDYPLQIASYLTLLKTSGNKTDVKELTNKIKTLELINDNKLYKEQSGNLKKQFEAIFSTAFTTAFLNKVNNDTMFLQQIADEQFYQLCYWQETDKQINYRRFFTVNGLICLNIQHQEVFDHYHQLIRTLLDGGIFQGLRVDHIDGLYDPEQYLERLRKLAGENTYIIVEKILEAGEIFPQNWVVQGNTGYDFLSAVNNLFTNKAGRKAFSNLYKTLTNKSTGIKKRIHGKKELILHEHMAGELENLYQLFIDLKLTDERDILTISTESVKSAIAELLIYFPVYRFYGNSMPLNVQESGALLHVFNQVRSNKPGLAAVLEILEDALLEKTQHDNIDYNHRALQFYQRCMQFSGPLMAKGVEDTLMYTYNRFIDHNEVGDSPESFGLTFSEFDKLMMDRGQDWPLSMNATATHDTKRGEDVRARLNVLTDMADEWADKVLQWQKMNAGLKVRNIPDTNDEYFIYQTIAGAYPMPGQDHDDFNNRLQEYLVKALREAKTNSNWAAPNEQYEAGVKQFVTALLNNKSSFMKSFSTFHKRVVDYGIINSLAQVLLKYTSPGVPDLYQGCELWDFSLVDPDNRRPVDYLKREQLLTEIENEVSPAKLWLRLWENRYDAQIKQSLIHALLTERGENTELFLQGVYIPIKVKGKYKDNILAFARHFEQSWYVIVLPLHLAGINKKGDDITQFNWGDTRILLPDDAPLTWQNKLAGTNGHANEGISVKEIFTSIPLAVLKLSYPHNGRSAGVLMHVTSLPSLFGIGDIGPQATAFVDFLYHSRQKYWQMLPVNPIDKQAGYSPYSSTSSMAGNILLISPELLKKDGLLKKTDLTQYELTTKHPINFEKAKKNKDALFEIAWKNFLTIDDQQALHQQFRDFKHTQADWLNEFALYEIIKADQAGKPWYEWPEPYKLRNATALKKIQQQEAVAIDKVKWLQFIFSRQWAGLKSYCNSKSISLFGDMPFYISYDSVDVWSQPQFFKLDDKGNRMGMAGVPPDYFSAEGQLWGMPVFRWDELKKTNYAWWVKRVKKNLEYFDLIRLDHFRAFADYWEVPAGEKNAINGSWKQGPGADFFETLKKELGHLPFVAEDLGEINEAVHQLRDNFELPGMKVLQFAFDEAMPFSDHILHNYTENNLVYTGTHDNNTMQGWYNSDITDKDRKRINKYVGKKLNDKTAYKTFIKLAYASVARVAILPIQDVLGLDESGRMNVPASPEGNWTWRLDPDSLTKKIAKQLNEWVIFYNR